jgi:hypothetical protein
MPAQCHLNRFLLAVLWIPVRFDSIFDRSTDEDMDMKQAAVDISGMVVDEVRNIGATFTHAVVADPKPVPAPDVKPTTKLGSYAIQLASYLQQRKSNPLLKPPPLPLPPPPPTLPVRIVRMNLMPKIPGLPESGMIQGCRWPADAEDGQHIVNVPQDLTISIHKRSERQLRHVFFTTDDCTVMPWIPSTIIT